MGELFTATRSAQEALKIAIATNDQGLITLFRLLIESNTQLLSARAILAGYKL